MSVEEVVWELEPHTRAKHEILKYHLGALFPMYLFTTLVSYLRSSVL
jgi:hypothetical protein